MQSQRHPRLNTPQRAVNRRRRAAALVVTLISAVAPNAFAGDMLVDRVVEVRLQVAALATDAGVAKAYAKLERKAKRACRSDPSALRLQGISAEDCAADLMDQFIVSASHDGLTAQHDKTVKLAAARTASKAG